MRISLILKSTMSKSCVQSQRKECCFGDINHTELNKKILFPYQGDSSKQGYYHSKIPPASRIGQIPAFLNACYDVKLFLNSRSSLTQVLDCAIKQLYALSAVLLLCLTLLLLVAQTAGLAFLLSCAITLPLGFQFMFCSVCLISATAFKIMY